MAEELSLRSLYNMVLKFQKFQSRVEEAFSIFALYNDADSNNPDHEILDPAIVTRFNKKTGTADLVIYSSRRGNHWQKIDVPVGVERGTWRPALLPATPDDLFGAVEEAAAEKKQGEMSVSGSRKPAAIARP